MLVKYIYIDDQPDKAGGIAAGLSIDNNNLIVKLFTAEKWDDQIKTINSVRSEYQGLLLDLQLRIPTDTLLYDAPALAQQIRNLAKEGLIEDLPILLCTTDELFLKMFDKTTNDDLFDKIYYKDNWVPEVNKKDISEFVSLAKGYLQIRENGDIDSLLKTNNPNNLNQIIDKVPVAKTVHSIAHFILKQLLYKSGLLVNEELLAIRLGIKTSSKDWNKLLEQLEKFKYNGVFSDAWDRWWIGDIMQWWRTISDGKSLRTMTCENKIQVLNNLGIQDVETILLPEKHNSTDYWYQCNLSGTPMSSDDGFILKGQDSKIDWQDKTYVSFNHIWNADSSKLEQEILDKIQISDTEKVKIIFQQKRL